VNRTTIAGSLATCVITIAATPAAAAPAAHAKNGDTHITGHGIEQTLDCNDSTLIVNGTGNTINAMGNCWAITVMGSSNTIIADGVTHDITAYGWDQTVFYHNGAPFVWDRGRELGMTNRLQQVPG
jgi:azurin